MKLCMKLFYEWSYQIHEKQTSLFTVIKIASAENKTLNLFVKVARTNK